MTRIAALLLLACAASAQPPAALTLQDAQAIALKNHPQVNIAQINALIAGELTAEMRAAYFPSVTGSLTAAGAADNTRIAAGQLNNPVIYNRLASGFGISQVLTDFGRTSNLVNTARLRAQAQQQNAIATRAQVLLNVNRAYFAALRTRTVLEVARQTVAARQLVVDQVTALAGSKLKSGLDVSFANVSLGEARLLLASAQNETEAANADLAAALGYLGRQEFQLTDAPMPPALPNNPAQLAADALRDRPEIAASRAEQAAALSFVKAERALQYPTVSAVAASGLIPGHEDTLHGRYGALGFNLNIPLFNGHLFSARRQEAEYRAQAAEQSLRDLENRIARDVQVAWLNANTASERLKLTADLLNQANQALDLARTRYNLGLSSIVELSQAQLAQTSAEIGSASARYDYQLQRAVLDYQLGLLK